MSDPSPHTVISTVPCPPSRITSTTSFNILATHSRNPLPPNGYAWMAVIGIDIAVTTEIWRHYLCKVLGNIWSSFTAIVLNSLSVPYNFYGNRFRTACDGGRGICRSMSIESSSPHWIHSMHANCCWTVLSGSLKMHRERFECVKFVIVHYS